MSATQRTPRLPLGPAHDALTVFEMDAAGELVEPPQHDLLTLDRALQRTIDVLQAVAVVAPRLAPDEATGKRIAWHFAALRDRARAQHSALADYLYAEAPRPAIAPALDVLAFAQSSLDHYRAHRTVKGL